MVDSFLRVTEGVTPDVFLPPEPAAEAEAQEDREEPKGEEKEEVRNVVYRAEVTREPRMKFFKVPRLGSYMAVPLVYSSFLFPESLDTALKDYAEYKLVVKRNEELMKEYEDRMAKLRAEEEAREEEEAAPPSKPKEGERKKKRKRSVSKAEPEDAEGENLEPPQLEEEKEPQYLSRQLSYVVCLDTMGQDREFAEEEKKFVMESVKQYKEAWEQHEKDRLTEDRKLKEEEQDRDAEFLDKEYSKVQEEEKRFVEEKITTVTTEMDEEEKREKEDIFRCEFKVRQITEGPFREGTLNLSKYNVVKMERIMQTLFYLLGYTREDLCEVATNKLFWKRARTLWNEKLLEEFQNYTPLGPKDGEYKAYQKINFLEKNLDGLVEEDVRNYSLSVSELLICLKETIEVRKADIFRRKAYREKLAREREDAIQRSEERDRQRAEELQAKKEEAMAVRRWMSGRFGRRRWRRRRRRKDSPKKPLKPLKPREKLPKQARRRRVRMRQAKKMKARKLKSKPKTRRRTRRKKKRTKTKTKARRTRRRKRVRKRSLFSTSPSSWRSGTRKIPLWKYRPKSFRSRTTTSSSTRSLKANNPQLNESVR